VEKDAATGVEEAATIFFHEPVQHHAPLHGRTVNTTPPLYTTKHTAVSTLAETSPSPSGMPSQGTRSPRSQHPTTRPPRCGYAPSRPTPTSL
jgi:hypothetical protein